MSRVDDLLAEIGRLAAEDQELLLHRLVERTQVTWWTTQDVADYCGTTIGTISSYRMRDQMPAPDRTYGRTHLWMPSTIRRWRPFPDG